MALLEAEALLDEDRQEKTFNPNLMMPTVYTCASSPSITTSRGIRDKRAFPRAENDFCLQLLNVNPSASAFEKSTKEFRRNLMESKVHPA